MVLLERIGSFFEIVLSLAADPINLAILFGSVLLGIMFGAMPGLTSTLGVALAITQVIYRDYGSLEEDEILKQIKASPDG